MASYQGLYQRGLLGERVQQTEAMLGDCCLCPRGCHVDRRAGEKGKCRVGREALVSSYGPHFGEERPLVGRCGSGTIFFTFCNLKCLFCQNYTISHLGEGRPVSREELAAVMLALQTQGCHNINLVTPTHVVPQILAALEVAVEKGLSIPLVYNCGGYESRETLKLLDGVVDIYMPDMKYADEEIARRYSGVRNYPQENQAAVREMHHQVGDLALDEAGIAVKGLLVRHLVLPNNLAGTSPIARFVAEEISTNTYLNIMAQYHPCYRAHKIPLLDRPLLPEEYRGAVRLAQSHGLTRLDGIRPRPLVRLQG